MADLGGENSGAIANRFILFQIAGSNHTSFQAMDALHVMDAGAFVSAGIG
ncbi:hypothetical protein Poly51_43530 [Rubripirellula tenax]|uniref:Uncharacterized protein n=1 Tax=Rubripirellula tenax TaxID=2528015 RepID=A0A5C6EUC4_9BACT|nr:hypothetical protein Poly51_43530 [Rubripirellula tenax]